MSGDNSNPSSTLVGGYFHSMEEVNEVTRAKGWQGEFHQLGTGRVTSSWWSLQLGAYALTSHHLDKRVHARLTPPKGCVTLNIMPSQRYLSVEGVEVGNHQVFLVGADSETDIVTPNESECETLTLPQSEFEASARVLFPQTRMDREPNRIRVFQCTPSRLSALYRETMGLLHNGGMSPEDVSQLLSRLLALMAGGSERHQLKAGLGNGANQGIARRAQEYIEEHYRETIRLEDLCRCTGVSLRTLQRSFSEYFQVSPSAYIKARRLNAARQGLVVADSSRHKVSDIALRSGFSHLGRFAVEYRHHFGESPRGTLTRAK